MVSFLKWMVPTAAALGLVLSISASSSKAADEKPAAAGGTITGTVVDKDGKAVEGAKIRVMKPMQRGQGGPVRPGGAQGGRRGGAQAQAADEKPAPAPGGGAGAGQGGRQRPAPVAEGTSDKDGKFSIANVPAGEYMVLAQVEGKGMARGNATVKAGASAAVELKLQDRPAGQRQPGGQGRGANRPAPAK